MMDPSFHRVPLCVALGEGKKESNGKAGAPVRRLLQKPHRKMMTAWTRVHNKTLEFGEEVHPGDVYLAFIGV